MFEHAASDVDSKVAVVVHIGTHGSESRAAATDVRVAGLGEPQRLRGGHGRDTPWGRMTFQDGVQTWANPRMA